MGLVLHFAPSNMTTLGAHTPLSLFSGQGDLPTVQESSERVDIFNGFGGSDEQNAPNP